MIDWCGCMYVCVVCVSVRAIHTLPFAAAADHPLLIIMRRRRCSMPPRLPISPPNAKCACGPALHTSLQQTTVVVKPRKGTRRKSFVAVKHPSSWWGRRRKKEGLEAREKGRTSGCQPPTLLVLTHHPRLLPLLLLRLKVVWVCGGGVCVTGKPREGRKEGHDGQQMDGAASDCEGGLRSEG